MANGMSEVQGLADILFRKIIDDVPFLDGYRMGYDFLKRRVIYIFEAEGQQFIPMFTATDQSVLQHLGIT